MRNSFPAMMASMLVFALAGFARAADSNPDEKGFIRNWLLLAPITLGSDNNGGEEIDKELIRDEGKIKPKEGEKIKVGDKELVWKAVKTTDYFFDVNEILGTQTENSAAFAVAYIVCDNDMKGLQLAMGSNDQGKVYLNGKEVVKFTDTRTLEEDSDTADNITLNKGVNVLVFKVINETNNWQGCLRFKKKDGTPVKDYKVQLTP
jgi:hypothetical protein